MTVDPKELTGLQRNILRAATGRSPRSLSALLEKEAVLGYAMVFPIMAVVFGFKVYPFIIGIWISLTDKVVGEPATFVGLANYINHPESQIFLRAAFNTILYTVSTTAIKAVLGMCLALVLYRKFKLSRLVRAAVLLPFIVPTALAALAWIWMLDPLFSVVTWTINYFWNLEISLFGLILKPDFAGQFFIPWLGDSFWAMFSVIMVNVWRGLPFFAIMFLAGLMTVPQELYDAGNIDGTNGWQRFRHITLPYIMPIVVVVLMFSFVTSFADFELVFVLTRGGPFNSTHLLATYAYQLSMASGKLGEGSAAALYMLPILAALIVWQLIYMRRDKKHA